MNPREMLAENKFRIEQALTLFGRPVGCMIVGSWQGGACELMVGLMALEPFDFCRLIAGVRFVPGEGLAVVRTVEPDDPRDNDEVLSRYFETSMDQIMAAAFLPLSGALAAAAELREERAEAADEKPVREMPATSAWLH